MAREEEGTEQFQFHFCMAMYLMGLHHRMGCLLQRSSHQASKLPSSQDTHSLANAILPKSTKVLSFCLSVSLAFIRLCLLISLWPHWPKTFTLPMPYTSHFSLRQYCTLVEVLWPPWWHRCRFPRLGFAGCLLVAWGLHRQMKLTLFFHKQVSPIEGF